MTNQRGHKGRSAGSEALRGFLCTPRALAQLTKKLDCGAGMVSRWSNGVVKPSTRWRLELQAVYGIEIAAWDREPMRRSA